jgi:molecular chaperone DnaK (HSP70)
MTETINVNGRGIGIDLGSTWCRVAVVKKEGELPSSNTDVSIILADGSHIPARIAETADGQIVVGRAAERRGNWADLGTAKLLGFGGAGHVLRTRTLSSGEVLGHVLRQVKQRADEHLQRSVEAATVAVPAWFSPEEIASVVAAAESAGFSAISTLPEPVASFLTFLLQEGSSRDPLTVCVFDFGGLMFEATVLEKRGESVRIVSTVGDHTLGGRRLDDEIAQWLEGHLARRGYDLGLSDHPRATQIRHRTRALAERAKLELSSAKRTVINVDGADLRESNGAPVTGSIELGRPELERLIRRFVDRAVFLALDAVASASERSDTPLSSINAVIMVGGSSQIPLVAALLEERFGRAPIFLGTDTVAIGAAVRMQTELTACGFRKF